MTEQEFEDQFDKGELDCAYCDFICDRYDAINKEHMLRLWEDDDVYADFKDSLVTDVVKKQQYSLMPNPLDNFPTIWSMTK